MASVRCDASCGWGLIDEIIDAAGSRNMGLPFSVRYNIGFLCKLLTLNFLAMVANDRNEETQGGVRKRVPRVLAQT